MEPIYMGMLKVKDTERRAAHLSNKLLCMHSSIQSPIPACRLSMTTRDAYTGYGSYSHPLKCFAISFIFAKW